MKNVLPVQIGRVVIFMFADTDRQLRKLSIYKMTKTQILKVIKETAAPHKLDREQKFQVFANVCDNMLAEGRITQEQHIRWTNIF